MGEPAERSTGAAKRELQVATGDEAVAAVVAARSNPKRSMRKTGRDACITCTP